MAANVPNYFPASATPPYYLGITPDAQTANTSEIILERILYKQRNKLQKELEKSTNIEEIEKIQNKIKKLDDPIIINRKTHTDNTIRRVIPPRQALGGTTTRRIGKRRKPNTKKSTRCKNKFTAKKRR